MFGLLSEKIKENQKDFHKKLPSSLSFMFIMSIRRIQGKNIFIRIGILLKTQDDKSKNKIKIHKKFAELLLKQ